MKSTEIFVEQLIIGLFIFFIGFMLVDGDLSRGGRLAEFINYIKGNNAVFVSVIFGFLIVGAAYLLGLLYDRWTDTLLEDIQQRQRIIFALGSLTQDEINEFQDGKEFERDPFPLHEIRLKIMLEGSAVVEHAGYLRSRIRLTRAMTTLMPVFFLSMMLRYTTINDKERLFIAEAIALIYIIVLFLKIAKLSIHPPKTKDLKWDNSYEKKRILKKEKDGKFIAKLEYHPYDFIMEPVFWGFLSIMIIGSYAAIKYTGNDIETCLFVLAFGAAATLLVGWTWWRISKTFYQFIFDYHQLFPKGSQVKFKK